MLVVYFYLSASFRCVALITHFTCARRFRRSAFKMSFRGRPIPGPPLTKHLAGITQLGLGTSGHAGRFRLSIASLYATSKGDPCAAP